jgi:hypothetical protein
MSYRLRGLAVLIAIAALLTLSTCGGGDGDPSDRIVIEATDPSADVARLEAPASVEAGRVEITLENRGKTLHDAQLFKYRGKHSADELNQQLLDNLGVAAKPEWVSPAGGVARTLPGETVTVTQVLEPGTYFVADTQEKPAGWPIGNASKGAISKLRVTGATRDRLSSAATITANDDGFTTSGIAAGSNRVTFGNAGKELHQVVAFPIRKGDSLADAKRALIKRMNGLTWLPVPFDHARATAVLDSGGKQVTTLDFEPGRYALVCFVSDRSGGESHLAQGIASELEVR